MRHPTGSEAEAEAGRKAINIGGIIKLRSFCLPKERKWNLSPWPLNLEVCFIWGWELSIHWGWQESGALALSPTGRGLGMGPCEPQPSLPHAFLIVLKNEKEILNWGSFFMMFTNRDILSSVLSLIRVLHCWSHQPLETALCLQKSPFRRVYESWKQTWALSLFIFLPQWERLTLTFLSCLCLQIFIYPVNLGRNLSKRQGRLALGGGRLVFETSFWHLLTMWPWASHCAPWTCFCLCKLRMIILYPSGI